MKLFLIVKKVWFDKIKSGEKRVEYRQVTPYWINRLSQKKYDIVDFQLGYSKKNRITFDIVDIKLEAIKLDFFGSIENEIPVFAIHFK